MSPVSMQDLPISVAKPLVPKILGVDHHAFYVIIGGLVFVRVGQALLSSLDKTDSRALLTGLGGGNVERTREGEEIIVVSDVLPHFCNISFARYKWMRVARVNGTPVLNLAHLAALAADILGRRAAGATRAAIDQVGGGDGSAANAGHASSSSDEAPPPPLPASSSEPISSCAPATVAADFIEIDFHCFFEVERRAAVLACAAVRESEAEILATHRVPSWCSPELIAAAPGTASPSSKAP
jgi:hypothetical protein